MTHKQPELFSKRSKPLFCNWLLLSPVVRKCKAQAVVTIHKAAYCHDHAEKATKMFGAAKPIYV